MVHLVNTILICVYGIFIRLLKLSPSKKSVLFLTLSSIQITLIVGTRTVVSGVDTIAYYYFFERIYTSRPPFAYFSSNFEPLYVLLAWSIKWLGGSFMALNIAMAALTMLFLSMGIYRLSRSPFFSIYLFVCFCLMNQMMNQYRQVLAFAIVLYAYSYLDKKDVLRYIFWIAVASGFHISALVVLPLILVQNIPITKQTVIRYIGLTAIAWLAFESLMYLLTFTPYAVYLRSIYNEAAVRSTILNLGVRVCMLIFAAVFYKRLKCMRPDIDVFYHMIILCTIIQLLTTRSAIFGRITTYFFLAYMVIIPEIVKDGYKKRGNRMIANSALFTLFTVWQYVYLSAGNNTQYASWLLNGFF